jgi:hypothetical protein
MTDASYDTDLNAWTRAQAAALRDKCWEALDIEHLAEEIESLGSEQEHAVESQLAILLLHLLKWHYQPARCSRSWRTSILLAQQRIARRLRRNPGLRSELPSLTNTAYADARKENCIRQHGALPIAGVSRSVQRASASGRIWNFTILLVVPLPPSR